MLFPKMTLNERFKVDESRTDKKSDLGQKSESDVSIIYYFWILRIARGESWFWLCEFIINRLDYEINRFEETQGLRPQLI